MSPWRNFTWLTNDLAGADQEFKAAAELAPVRSLARLTYAEFKARTGAPDRSQAPFAAKSRGKCRISCPLGAFWRELPLPRSNSMNRLHFSTTLSFRDPANIEARLLQAQVWLARGETKKAIEALERLSTAFPQALPIKYNLARAYLQDNNSAKAASIFDQVVAADPNNAEAVLLLGEANLRSWQCSASRYFDARIEEEAAESGCSPATLGARLPVLGAGG